MRTADPLPRVADGVVLRRLAASDLPAFQSYRHDPQLARYQGWTAMADSEATSFLAGMGAATLLRPGVWSQIGIANASSPVLIGDIGLLLDSDGEHVEIGFTLESQSQGRGLATAAVAAAIDLVFELTAAERVVGITDARNLPSIRLLERVGMTRTDAREAMFREEPCIEHSYAISRFACLRANR